MGEIFDATVNLTGSLHDGHLVLLGKAVVPVTMIRTGNRPPPFPEAARRR